MNRGKRRIPTPHAARSGLVLLIGLVLALVGLVGASPGLGDRAPVAAAASAPTASSNHDGAATWLRTVADATLWSGPGATAGTQGILPAGSYLEPLGGDPGGRVLAFATGDGHGQAPGPVWLAQTDVAPSGPPPWVADSELDGDGAPPPVPGEPHRTSAAAPPAVTAGQVAVVDDASGRLLYGLDSDMPEAPASTTKIATAIVTLAHVSDLSQRVHITIDGDAMAEADGSSIMGLVPGQNLTYTTLLYGLLLPSGNDAAEQLALAVGGTRTQFVQWMNDEAASLGLQDTHFKNPSGLDEEGHDVSAHDLAILARTAMQNPTFRTIVASPSYTGDGITLYGHNPLLGVYPGTDGVKTGSTDAAGHTMVASVTHNGHRVYVVVMHSDDLLADCSALFDWTWDAFGW